MNISRQCEGPALLRSPLSYFALSFTSARDCALTFTSISSCINRPEECIKIHLIESVIKSSSKQFFFSNWHGNLQMVFVHGRSLSKRGV